MTRSLRVRNYRLFASGQIISLTGSWMQSTAQDWLVLQLTHNSATAIGIVTALQFAPIMVLTLYGGLIADRFDKRRMLMITQTVLGFLAAGMGILVVSGQVWGCGTCSFSRPRWEWRRHSTTRPGRRSCPSWSAVSCCCPTRCR
ncbi:MFS transporter [Fodinicola feengrottensis]|uniref:MFS transporter n=1 Tax=Fodinicola feengrottensis TaxID=435914 RepID=UPI0013D8043C|nr:MFS transporter [Fodinicola feengrottensis]